MYETMAHCYVSCYENLSETWGQGHIGRTREVLCCELDFQSWSSYVQHKYDLLGQIQSNSSGTGAEFKHHQIPHLLTSGKASKLHSSY